MKQIQQEVNMTDKSHRHLRKLSHWKIAFYYYNKNTVKS